MTHCRQVVVELWHGRNSTFVIINVPSLTLMTILRGASIRELVRYGCGSSTSRLPDSPRNSPLTSADAAKIASPIGVMLSILK